MNCPPVWHHTDVKKEINLTEYNNGKKDYYVNIVLFLW